MAIWKSRPGVKKNFKKELILVFEVIMQPLKVYNVWVAHEYLERPKINFFKKHIFSLSHFWQFPLKTREKDCYIYKPSSFYKMISFAFMKKKKISAKIKHYFRRKLQYIFK